MTVAPLRALAFYLPQFHPIPENNAWWGPGFTEWRNVAPARPRFAGHTQPHLPADLGFYDLRLPETRAAQAELAHAHGLSGFVYYHYWFNGRRLLEQPFDGVRRLGQPDFPFCLCWANESWRRTWDGRTGEYLIRQEHSAEDDLAHLRWLAEQFGDRRYLRVNGRPVFLIYRASQLPDAAATLNRWRTEALRLGVGELYLCRVESFPDEHGDPHASGFDAAVQFQPDWTQLGEPLRRGRLWRWARRLRLAGAGYAQHRVYDYAEFARRMAALPPPPYLRYPGVMPGWDNTARRPSGAVIFKNSTPAAYEAWLRRLRQQFVPPSPDENLLFINAWNEWGEGAHLEPDQRHGRAYLEATRRVLAPEGHAA